MILKYAGLDLFFAVFFAVLGCLKLLIKQGLKIHGGMQCNQFACQLRLKKPKLLMQHSLICILIRRGKSYLFNVSFQVLKIQKTVFVLEKLLRSDLGHACVDFSFRFSGRLKVIVRNPCLSPVNKPEIHQQNEIYILPIPCFLVIIHKDEQCRSY